MRKTLLLVLLCLCLTGMAYKPKGVEGKIKQKTENQAVSATGSVVIYGSIALGYVALLLFAGVHYALIRRMHSSCSRNSGKE